MTVEARSRWRCTSIDSQGVGGVGPTTPPDLAEGLLTARRSMLGRALRSGSAAAVARAAARLRLRTAELEPTDASAARRATMRLGHLLREERFRRRVVTPATTGGRVTSSRLRPRSSPVPRLLRALTLASVVLLAAAAIASAWPRPDARRGAPVGGPADEPAVGASVASLTSPPPASTAEPAPFALPVTLGLTGITSPTYVAPVVPIRTSAPAPPTAAPGPAAPQPGGRVGGGGPPPTATPPPAPSSAVFLPANGLVGLRPLQPGERRWQGLVVGADGLAIADVCIEIGPRSCQPISSRSDSFGSWYFDLPAIALIWDVRFVKAGYTTITMQINSGANAQSLMVIRLAKSTP